MAGKTISGTVTKPVTIGAGGYSSPLTITSTGRVAPASNYYGATAITVPITGTVVSIINHGGVFGVYGDGSTSNGYAGGNGIEIDSTTSLTNTGFIFAAGGGFGGTFGGAGGIGVDAAVFATITDSSTGYILGGYGGYAGNPPNNGDYFYGAAGHGGAGLDLQTSGTLNNAGRIVGGAGGNAESYTRYFVNGGDGVDDATEAAITNSGTIIGGRGGIEDVAATPRGLEGGQGVSMQDLGRLTNSGAIIGGAGGFSSSADVGGYGNEGVFLNEATASNTGLITGGAGAAGVERGGAGGLGVAIYSYASLSNAKGTIIGGAGGQGTYVGGGGADGVIVSTYGTVNNTGHITGGAGGFASNAAYQDVGGAGGIGVYLDSGKLTNSGTITGGNGGAESGGYYKNQHAGAGGIGVAAIAASIINYGLIRGGNGGYIDGQGGTAGIGGAGISIADATFSNHGTIIGGIGGSSGQGAAVYGYAGVGGAGAVVGAAGKVNNSGTIIGGGSGTTIYAGTVGGAGVYIAGGTFIDTGTVIGGAGVSSQGPGTMGVAVLFGGSIAGTLMAGPGAKFIGGITGAHGGSNVIELTGSSSTPFTGVGVSITGIADFSFASGAERSLEGSYYGLDFSNVTGFTLHDTIVVDGFTAALKSTSADPGPYLGLFTSTGGGVAIGINRATAKELLVTDSGGKTSITSVMQSSARAIGANAAEFVGAGANAVSTTIKTGGFEEVYNGGTASSTTIAGGELLLKIGATAKGNIAFTTITGGDLQINSTVLPTTTITGFIAGDTIDLETVVYSKYETLTVATAGTITIKSPGVSYNLDVAGVTVGETGFVLSADDTGYNGTELTKSTAKVKMGFVSLPAGSTAAGAATMSGAAAGLPAFSALDDFAPRHDAAWYGQTVQVNGGLSGGIILSDQTRIDFIALAHHGAGFG